MKALRVEAPRVCLALVGTDGRVKPLLDVTALVVWAWVGLSILWAVGDLLTSILEWGASYSALLGTLLLILLAALLWAVDPRAGGRARGRGVRPGG